MYIPVEKCATSDIRMRLRELGLPHSKTRSECIRTLQEHDVYVLDVHVVPQKTQKRVLVEQPAVMEMVPEPVSRNNLFTNINVFDVTPDTPDLISQTQADAITTTDAVFSHAAIRNLTVKSSLNVGGYNIVQEIDRIKRLRFLLLQDFESIRVSFDNMRVAFQRTVNQDLPMYNIAHDIAHHSFADTIQFENNVVPNITSPSFYGKIEDSTVNLDMNFVVDFEDTVRPNRFTIQLPHAMDTQVLSIVPVMVTIYFDYDNETQEYRQVSSISHGYIDKENPDQMVVYASIFKDITFTRFQLDIAARYLCQVDSNTITPMRFGSLHKEQFTHPNGNVAHQWSDVDRRIDLFTNLDVSDIPINTDTIQIPLPVPMVVSPVQQIVGFGSLHYTTYISALSQTVYTTNTPLVYVSESNPSMLVVKSNLFKGFRSNTSNMQSMKLATHISYQRAIPDNFVYNVTRTSDRIVWYTRSPINPYYFNIIRVNDTNVLNTLMGSQNKWSVSTLGANDVRLRIELNDGYIFDELISN